ncbi:unnamed protein product [Pocillopora meandrina]|uniref:Uncharacterized protein n=1 Tax=Pocillopora meandrina TaxID=46732 RepID=A0AAU9X8U7_9CNID|nr:unnamed protein product [Pocillopora meandrina]
MSGVYRSSHRSHYATSFAAHMIPNPTTIFTSTAISVDRLTTLALRLAYRNVVTLRRVRAAVFCFGC